MNKLKLASGVLLVFLVGVLAGSLGTGIYYKKQVEKIEAGGPSVSERIQIIQGRFSNELDLTTEQRTQIEKIIKEAQEKLLAIGRKSLPDIEEINEKTFATIKEKLTETQKKKLETLVQRMDDFRKRLPGGQSRPQQGTQQQGGPQQGAQQQGMPQQQGSPQQQQGMPQQGQGMPSGEQQPGGHDEAGNGKKIRLEDELKSELTLTLEQVTKVAPIVESFFKERQEVFSRYNQEKQDSKIVKSALEEKEKAFDKDLSALLTKEQIEKYKKARKSGAIKLSPPDTP